MEDSEHVNVEDCEGVVGDVGGVISVRNYTFTSFRLVGELFYCFPCAFSSEAPLWISFNNSVSTLSLYCSIHNNVHIL